MNLYFLRIDEVERRTGLSRPTIYRRMREGTFPNQINLGGRAVAWSSEAIAEWIKNCIDANERVA